MLGANEFQCFLGDKGQTTTSPCPLNVIGVETEHYGTFVDPGGTFLAARKRLQKFFGDRDEQHVPSSPSCYPRRSGTLRDIS